MSTKSLILLNLLSALGAEDPAPKAAGSFLKEKQFDVAELFAPLRKAAQVVQSFSDNLAARAKTTAPSSLLQDDSWMDSPNVSKQFKINSEKTDRSLAEARENLRRIDKELAAERRMLSEQGEKFKASSVGTLNMHDEGAASFLQERSFDLSKLPGFGGATDPLSPQNLEKWREGFEEKLRKAREIAREGLPSDVKASFIQEENKSDDEFNSLWSPQSYVEAQDKIRRGAKQVDRLQEQFKEGMEKLQRENAELMAQSQAELAKYQDMKSKLQGGASFLQEFTKHNFLTEEEVKKQDDDLIKKIERRWKAKAAEIMEQSKKQRAFIAKEKTELLALAHKTKEEDHVEMEKMRESVRSDIDRLRSISKRSNDVASSIENTK